MASPLAGKSALVTGGGSGIGRATALAFAREGARVTVADVSPEGGEETVRMIGVDATFVRADVTRPNEVEALVARVVEAHGRIDCAFNNAGVGGTQATTHEYPEDAFDRVIAVNLKGVWLCMRAEVRRMLEGGGGAIVNTASVAGLVGAAGLPIYSASKHAVVGLTKSAALEYARQGIRVNAVCPGVIETPMADELFASPGMREGLRRSHPGGRFGAPSEVAEAVVWLCSDAASFVTGHALAVDGGFVAR